MTTVYWAPYSANASWIDVLFFEPEPVLPQIVKDRDCSKHSHFAKCPAFQTYYRNMYLIRAPIDIEIKYDAEGKCFFAAPQAPEFLKANVNSRLEQIGPNDPPLISLNFFYLFIAEEKCAIELLPVTHHDTKIASKIRLIQGTFDISKWFRPIDFAFELLNPNEILYIKRGDPLFYVQFVSDNKVKLERKELSADVIRVVEGCLDVKNAFSFLGLTKMYELTAKLRANLWFNKKKCPFNWRSK